MQTIAYELRNEFPDIRFTSGQRSVSKQVKAMATNVLKNSQWIRQTYKASRLRDALQFWVDHHPNVVQSQLEAGLQAVFDAATPEEVLDFSAHLTGDAIDVQPITGPTGEAIKNNLRNRPGLFLDTEGGQVRWHYQRRRR